MTVKLRPCLRFRACGWGCVRWRAPAGKGVVGLLSWHGSHFWVCIIFCEGRHGDSVTKPDYYCYYYYNYYYYYYYYYYYHYCKPDCILHADLEGHASKPLLDLFQSLRPDIAILTPSSIETLELTICYETNSIKSKTYKESKYENLHENLNTNFTDFILHKYTVEITTLGIISDINSFTSSNLNSSMPDHIRSEIIGTVVSKSFGIYCNRNNSTWTRSPAWSTISIYEPHDWIFETRIYLCNFALIF